MSSRAETTISVAPTRLDQLDQLEPVAVGQAEIEQDDVGLVDVEQRQPLARCRRLRRPVSRPLDCDAQQAADMDVVLDDQDLGGNRHASLLGMCRRLVERAVEREHIDARFAEEAEQRVFGLRG